jgi:hypothetical protein
VVRDLFFVGASSSSPELSRKIWDREW